MFTSAIPITKNIPLVPIGLGIAYCPMTPFCESSSRGFHSLGFPDYQVFLPYVAVKQTQTQINQLIN